MLARTLVMFAMLFATGCAVAPESLEEEAVGTTEQATRIRTTVRNGCYISVCKKDGSGQMHSVRSGNYVCDLYKNCYCEHSGETAQCDYGSTDCRQTCTKTTTEERVEWQPVLPMPTAVLAY